MTIFTDTPTRRSALFEFEAPMPSVLGAVAEEALTYSPFSSLWRKEELDAANLGPKTLLGRGEPGTDILRPDIARQRVKDEGVELTIPEGGIRAGALNILIERKKEEMRRQDVLSRGAGGFLPGAARIAVGLGASALDPLNVASAFIPVIGEARYAYLLGRAGGAVGRAGVRAGIGAAEGTVGAALLEPLIYRTAKQEQADYDISDSLWNIAFGTALGGGLHVGVGAIADATGRAAWQTAKANPAEPLPKLLEDVDFKTREAAMRTAVGQAVDGREIDVEPILGRAVDPPPRTVTAEPTRPANPPSEAVFSLASLGRDAQLEEFAKSRPDTLSVLADADPVRKARELAAEARETQDKFLDRLLGEEVASRYRNARRKAGSDSPSVADKGSAETRSLEARMTKEQLDALDLDWLPDEATAEWWRAVADTVSAHTSQFPEDLPAALREAAMDLPKDGRPWEQMDFDQKLAAVAIQQVGKDAQAFGVSIEDLLKRTYDDIQQRYRGTDQADADFMSDDLLRRIAAFMRGDTPEVRDAPSPQRTPEQPAAMLARSQPTALETPDEKAVAAGAKAEVAEDGLAEAIEDAQRLADALGDTEAVARELAPYDALAESADTYGRAILAAASCSLRKGE